ncbi:MAG: hypothetical protein EOO29_44950, partial [Comamonadaceae bacterium]
MTDFSTLEMAIDGPDHARVARIWLNRPDLRNAIDDVFIRELGEAFAQAEAAPGVRAVVLGARGPAFCAGANLNWMKRAAEYTHEQNLQDAAGLPRMLRTLEQSRLPVIARTHGADHVGADGGGDQSDLHFAQAEVGRVGRDGQIAHRHQPHAAGIHVALDARDDRQAALFQRAQHARQAGGVLQVLFVRVLGGAL